MPQLDLTLSIPVSIKQDGKWYICSCQALDIHSQGRTEAEATRNFETTMSLFVEGCLEMGTLEKVLHDCGFHLTQDGPWEEATAGMINIPVHLFSSAKDADAAQNRPH